MVRCDIDRCIQLEWKNIRGGLIGEERRTSKSTRLLLTLIVRIEDLSDARRLPVTCVQDSDADALGSQYTSMSNLQLEGMPTRKEQECSMERSSFDMPELNVSLSILYIELLPSGGCD